MPSGPPGLAGAVEEEQRSREARQLDPNSREGLLKRLRDIGKALVKFTVIQLYFVFVLSTNLRKWLH